ncbi:MAG: hypothetical protein Kow0037_21640 [Calditrichia bacterium]
MAKCDQFKEWILFPEMMTPREVAELKNHLKTCADCRLFSQQHLQMVDGFHKDGNEHIEHDLLIKYVMTEAEPHASAVLDYALKQTQQQFIQKHLQKCPACLVEYEDLKAEYLALQSYVEQSEIPDLEFAPLKWYERVWEAISELPEALWQHISGILAQPGSQWITATAMAAAVVLLLLNLPGTPVKNSSWSNEYLIKDKPMIGLVRGAERQDWHEFVEKIRQEKYKEAYQAAQAWVNQHPQDPLKTEIAYWGGLSALYYCSQEYQDGNLEAVRPVLTAGIELLESHLPAFQSDRQKEKALWYLSKAYLMESNQVKAKTALEEVVKLHGFYFSRATEMLEKLQ